MMQAIVHPPQVAPAPSGNGASGHLDDQAAAQALAPFFTHSQQPLDPASLGEAQDYPAPWGLVVALLQARKEPGAVLSLLSSQQLQALWGNDPEADPEQALRDRLAQRWRLLDAAALMQPPAPPDYLIEGMVRLPSLVTVYGAPGSLKSMFLMDLAVCVAGGLPWLPPLPSKGSGGSYGAKPGPVLWLDCDNGQHRLQERFGALCRAHGVDDVPLWAIPIPNPLFSAADPIDVALLTTQVHQLGARLVVLDNLGTISGGADENTAEMVGIMSSLRAVAEQTGAAVFVIHHARKGGSTGGREGDRLRGHSSIEASLDLALLIEREGDTITAQSTKTRDDPVAPFEALWAFEQGNDRALLSGRFWHLREATPRQPQHVIIAQGLAALLDEADGSLSQTALRQAIQEEWGCGDSTARQAIKYADERSLIVGERQGPYQNAPILYRPATARDQATRGRAV